MFEMFRIFLLNICHEGFCRIPVAHVMIHSFTSDECKDVPSDLNLVLLNQDIPCLWKQCRSRSVGFCTICHSVCEFMSTIWIKRSDWLTNRNGHGFLLSMTRFKAQEKVARVFIYMYMLAVVLQEF